MPAEIKSVLSRSSDTLLQDALGAALLVVLLIASLYFPGL